MVHDPDIIFPTPLSNRLEFTQKADLYGRRREESSAWVKIPMTN
jgi:hypothetical protein